MSSISSGTTLTTALVQTADTSGVLQLQTNGTTTAVTIDTSQNVGIGVTPDSIGSNWKALELANGIYLASYTGSTNADMYLGCNNYWNGTAYIGKVSGYNATQYEQYQGQHRWWNTNGSNVTGGSSFTFTQAMTLDNSGNLVVGATSQIGSEQVGISFADATKNGLGIQTQGSTSGAGFVVFRISSGAPIGNISRVGTTSAVVYNTTSDQRLKSNIADATSVLDKLISIKVRQFDWTEGDLHQDYGFIAQELEPVLSGIVTKGKTEEDIWQLDYSRLTPHLVKAIQEQQAMITTLQTQVTALQSKG